MSGLSDLVHWKPIRAKLPVTFSLETPRGKTIWNSRWVIPTFGGLPVLTRLPFSCSLIANKQGHTLLYGKATKEIQGKKKGQVVSRPMFQSCCLQQYIKVGTGSGYFCTTTRTHIHVHTHKGIQCTNTHTVYIPLSICHSLSLSSFQSHFLCISLSPSKLLRNF